MQVSAAELLARYREALDDIFVYCDRFNGDGESLRWRVRELAVIGLTGAAIS